MNNKSIDRAGERGGIVLAGNILADLVKNVDCYPEKGMLANITSISRAVGGSVPNTAINLAKIGGDIPLCAIGLRGDDEYGRYAVEQMEKYGINTDRVRVSDTAPTGFSDVISLPTGERTFFHARGANAEFCPDDVDVSALDCELLHIGYIFLLDRFDEDDEEYGTVMARFLREVKGRGIKTSVDAVSDCTADYHKKILPALKYCDYIIVNEIESCGIWGLASHDTDGRLLPENIRLTMERMAQNGVGEKVIVHSKEAGFCFDVKSGKFTAVPSLKIPENEIMGSVGAGDAFCAGCLFGIYTGMTDLEILEFASAAAACSLFAANSVDGMLPKDEIVKLTQKYGRLSL